MVTSSSLRVSSDSVALIFRLEEYKFIGRGIEEGRGDVEGGLTVQSLTICPGSRQ